MGPVSVIGLDESEPVRPHTSTLGFMSCERLLLRRSILPAKLGEG